MNNTSFSPQPPGPILRLLQVKVKVGLGRSSIYKAVKAGTFPAPIKLGERAIGWTASSIDAWIQSRVLASGHQEGA